jgi:hypothetical protein
MCDKSSFAVPQKYWHDMTAFELAKTTVGVSEIRCG